MTAYRGSGGSEMMTNLVTLRAVCYARMIALGAKRANLITLLEND